jgi:hypothetical protein
MFASSQKRSTANSSNPLEQAGILQHVLDYVGPGHWCFVAEVSSLWGELYKRVASTETQLVQLFKKKTIICVPKMPM